MVTITYKVSEKEMARREAAFLSLSASLLLGLGLASKFLKVPIPIQVFVGIAITLAVANAWLKLFFNSFLKFKICMSEKELVRKNKKYALGDARKVSVVWTTRNTIREIGIFFCDNKSLFINGLEDMERFKKDLLERTGKKIEIKNSKELGDYDSLLFYPILGLSLSLGAGLLATWLARLDYQAQEKFLYSAIAFLLAVFIYIAKTKQISKRY